jgi:hypothetical protein
MEGEVLGQSAEQSAPVNSSVESSTSTERVFKQSEVNDLIKRVKSEEFQKRERLYQEQPQYAAEKYGSQPTSQPTDSSLNESEYRRIAAEEAQRIRDQEKSEWQSRSEQENAQRIVKNFWDKISTGKEKYEDFDKVTGDIELSRFPNVVQILSEHLDNSSDVLYELGKNRLKMAQLEQLSYMSPKDAMIEAKRLAESIKANEAAGKYKQPNAPLSQQRPSNVGTEAGSVLSMRDLKAKYKA